MRVLSLTKWVAVSVILLVLLSNLWIISSTQDQIHSTSQSLMGAEVALVFGTSDRLVNGEDNPFFKNRVRAAADLLKSGKVEKLLLSGSKDSVYYDEAIKMQKAIIKLGVDKKDVILDQYGNRTLVSIARLRDIYHFDQCVLVTQKYHAYRSVFIANKLGVSAECFLADTPDIYEHKKAILRELFARTKALIDLYILYPEIAKS
ncbi:MAG: YdcF family protein [Reichenbachiella sp.]